MNRITGRLGVRSVLAALVLAMTAIFGVATGAQADDAYPCDAQQSSRAGHLVQYCPLTQGNVPVYNTPDAGNGATVVGRLVNGGRSNWFVGDQIRSDFRLGAYTNYWWAYTLADNGRWGWVPEVYFRGGDNNEGDAFLKVCNTAGNFCS
jgi:hypothetical protein